MAVMFRTMGIVVPVPGLDLGSCALMPAPVKPAPCGLSPPVTPRRLENPRTSRPAAEPNGQSQRAERLPCRSRNATGVREAGAAQWRIESPTTYSPLRGHTGRLMMTAAAEHPSAAALPQQRVTSLLPVTPAYVLPVLCVRLWEGAAGPGCPADPGLGPRASHSFTRADRSRGTTDRDAQMHGQGLFTARPPGAL